MANQTNRNVIVIGGSSGIGAAIAQAFRQNGDRVSATAATAPELDRARADDQLEGVEFSQLDVRDAAQIQSWIHARGDMDVVVNCAGIIQRHLEHDPEVFAQVLDINLTGTMRVCSAARASLKKTRGCIVNTASMLSFFGGGLVPAYSASKGGIAQLTKSLAIAYASDSIRVNAVAPGWIATPLTQALQDDPVRSGPILTRTPMARWGRPQDVAGPVMFLASDAAAFVTGVVLPVDGGYLIT